MSSTCPKFPDSRWSDSSQGRIDKPWEIKTRSSELVMELCCHYSCSNVSSNSVVNFPFHCFPSLRLRNSPDVRRTCFGRGTLLGDNHCFRRRVQHSNEYFKMESWFSLSSSCWLGRHVQDLLSEFQDGVCTFAHAASAAVSVRRCRCHTCPSSMQHFLPASVVSLHRAGLWSNATLQRSVQCSGLTSHKSRCTFDDPLDWLSPTDGLSGTVWLPSPMPQSPARCRT